MKRCPKCDQLYSDKTLNYCLNDGAALLWASDVEETVAIFDVATEPFVEPARQRLTFRKKSYLFIAFGLVVAIGVVLWVFLVRRDLEPNQTVISQPANTPISKDGEENWIALTQVANNDIRVHYLVDGKTLKLRFTNNDVADVSIKYKISAEVLSDGKWRQFSYPDATVFVKSHGQAPDNYPLVKVDNFRKLAVEITDWKYSIVDVH